MENKKEVIQKIAEKFSESSEEVISWYSKLAYYELMDVALIILAISIVGTVYYIINQLFKTFPNIENGKIVFNEEYDNKKRMIFEISTIFLGIVLFIGTFLMFEELNEAIKAIASPKAYALNELLSNF